MLRAQGPGSNAAQPPFPCGKGVTRPKGPGPQQIRANKQTKGWRVLNPPPGHPGQNPGRASTPVHVYCPTAGCLGTPAAPSAIPHPNTRPWTHSAVGYGDLSPTRSAHPAVAPFAHPHDRSSSRRDGPPRMGDHDRTRPLLQGLSRVSFGPGDTRPPYPRTPFPSTRF